MCELSNVATVICTYYLTTKCIVPPKQIQSTLTTRLFLKRKVAICSDDQFHIKTRLCIRSEVVSSWKTKISFVAAKKPKAVTRSLADVSLSKEVIHDGTDNLWMTGVGGSSSSQLESGCISGSNLYRWLLSADSTIPAVKFDWFPTTAFEASSSRTQSRPFAPASGRSILPGTRIPSNLNRIAALT